MGGALGRSQEKAAYITEGAEPGKAAGQWARPSEQQAVRSSDRMWAVSELGAGAQWPQYQNGHASRGSAAPPAPRPLEPGAKHTQKLDSG